MDMNRAHALSWGGRGNPHARDGGGKHTRLISVHPAWTWDQALQIYEVQKNEERKVGLGMLRTLKSNAWHEKWKKESHAPRSLSWSANGAYYRFLYNLINIKTKHIPLE